MLINLLVVLPTYSGFIHSVSLDTEISAEACLVVWTISKVECKVTNCN